MDNRISTVGQFAYLQTEVSATALSAVKLKSAHKWLDERGDEEDHRSATTHRIGQIADEILENIATISHAVDNTEASVVSQLEIAIKKISDLTAALAAKGQVVHALNDPEVRKHIWALTDGHCAYCNTKLEPFGQTPQGFCVEHVVPRAAGGPDHIKNYVPSCLGCNSAKSDRHVLTFVKRHVARRAVAAQLRVVGSP